MGRFLTKTRQQQQHRNLSMALLLVSYSLSLCTLSPLVHADLTRRVGQTQHSSAEHCARPFPVAQTTTPQTPGHERTSEPFCCELRGANNKALSASFIWTGASPFVFVAFLPPHTYGVMRKEQVLHLIQARHSSRPPPLYLFHATFLI